MTVYRHGIGHVYVGGYMNVDIDASNVAGARMVRVALTRDRVTREVALQPDVVVHLVEVFGAVDDWAELSALLRLLGEAAAYDGGGQ